MSYYFKNLVVIAFSFLGGQKMARKNTYHELLLRICNLVFSSVMPQHEQCHILTFKKDSYNPIQCCSKSLTIKKLASSEQFLFSAVCLHFGVATFYLDLLLILLYIIIIIMKNSETYTICITYKSNKTATTSPASRPPSQQGQGK